MGTPTEADKEHALTCWEIAHSAEEITFAVFARIAGTRARDGGAPTFVGSKQAFERFAKWVRSHGLAFGMEGNAAAFDREALLALAGKLRPALSPEAATRNLMKPQETSRTNKGPQETDVLDTKALGRLLLVSEWKARELMAKPGFPSFLVDDGARRVLRIDVLAWIEARKQERANTVGGKR